MFISRGEVERMTEADLRVKVLLPLFRAMKFKDVVLYHGGPQEQGKDIVMWEHDAIRVRRNVAVVAKAGRISGRASGSSSAGEVATQIRQCFNAGYKDSISLLTQQVDRVLVVASGPIGKEATVSLSSLTKEFAGRLDIVDGDKLFELIAQYLPVSNALMKLEEAKNSLDSVSEHHRIVASTAGNIVTLTTEPKHPRAYEDQPLKFSLSFSYPPTDEGKRASEELKRHFETGSPVSVPSSFIHSIDMPEFLKAYLGESGSPMRIELGTQTRDSVLMVNMVIDSASGSIARVHGIELRYLQIGSRFAILSNQHQSSMWHFHIELDRGVGQMVLQLSLREERLNVEAELDAVLFQEALSAGGVFHIDEARTGAHIVTGKIPAGFVDAPSTGLKELLTELSFLQSSTTATLFLPSRNISAEELREIFEITAQLRAGTIVGTADGLDASLSRFGAEEAIGNGSRRISQSITVLQEMQWSLFDVQVPIGTVVTVIEGLGLSDDAKTNLQELLVNDPSGDSFDVRLIPLSGKSKAVRRYLRFIPKDEAEEITRRLAS
jgi:hypothetical protein